jgi:uncharacterized protein (TIGR02466 family)
MGKTLTLFVTRVYRAALMRQGLARFTAQLEQASKAIARDDHAGQAWCRQHGYAGYTSYASLTDLTWRDPLFAALQTRLDAHVAHFARQLDFDLQRRPLTLDSIWINVLEPGGVHTSHIHPRSVVSGTFYVTVPKGSSALKLEDPRSGLMMMAPPRKPRAREGNRPFVYLEPKAGDVILWESWLRHEVPVNRASGPRISISFNYGWS